MPITLTCPSCSHRLKVPDSAAGRRGKCPGCGAGVDIPAAASVFVPANGADDGIPFGPRYRSPEPAPVTPPAPVKPRADEGRVAIPAPVPPLRVTVVDFDMRFGSLVTFMVKAAVAAIPALIILAVLAAGFSLAATAFLAAAVKANRPAAAPPPRPVPAAARGF